MNKAELIEIIAKKTASPKIAVETFLNATLQAITETLANGEEVKLVGFGTFSKSVRKARQGRNPKTGATVKIPKTVSPRFKPGKDLKDALN